MAEINIQLQPKPEQLFHYLEATGLDVPTIIGYGGARGGGKSRSARDLMMYRRAKYPGSKGVIIRRVYEDVKVNHIDVFFEEHPELRQYYNTQEHELTLPNRSRIKFMYAEDWTQVQRKFMGPEFMDVFVDQAEQFEEREIRRINTVKRAPGVEPGLCKMVLFFNPGGIGNVFLKRIFVEKKFKENESPKNYAFIQAYGWDNYIWVTFSGLNISFAQYYYGMNDEQRKETFIYLTSYGQELNSLPGHERAGQLYGDFDNFEGQYYGGVWDTNKHVLKRDETQKLLLSWWTRWLATDWGFEHWCVTYWFCTGMASIEQLASLGIKSKFPASIAVVYREYVTTGRDELDIAEDICEETELHERKTLRKCFLSPDAKQKRSSANTIKDQFNTVFRKEKFPMYDDADNQRVAGWRLIYQCLLLTERYRNTGQEIEELLPYPLLFVSVECSELINAIPLLIHDPDEQGDVLKTINVSDDCADALRYGMKTFFKPGGKPSREERAMVVYNSTQDPTSRAIKMRAFQENEKRKVMRLPRGLRR